MKIFKYKLEITDHQTIEMPFNASILTVQMQNGSPRLWAIVDETSTSWQKYYFRTYGTGHDLDDDYETQDYIGTYQVQGLVFHVFKENL